MLCLLYNLQLSDLLEISFSCDWSKWPSRGCNSLPDRFQKECVFLDYCYASPWMWTRDFEGKSRCDNRLGKKIINIIQKQFIMSLFQDSKICWLKNAKVILGVVPWPLLSKLEFGDLPQVHGTRLKNNWDSAKLSVSALKGPRSLAGLLFHQTLFLYHINLNEINTFWLYFWFF